MGKKAQKRRCGTVYFNPDAVFIVAQFGPAFRHADAERRRDKERHRRAVIDAVSVKRKGFRVLTAIVRR